MNWMLMPLRRYADFSGRSRRKEYWMFVLFQALVGIAAGAISLLLFATGMSETGKINPRLLAVLSSQPV